MGDDGAVGATGAVGDEPDLSFVALTGADLPTIRGWLTAEHVAPWWAPTAAARDEVEGELGRTIDGTDPAEVFVVHLDGRPVGLIQRYRIDDDPEWKATLAVATDASGAAGIDYLIGDPDLVGRGVGSAMVRAFVASTFARYPDVDRILVDPQAANRPSWRALERAGFTRIWTGHLDDDDPANVGDCHLYRLTRAEAAAS